MSGTQLTPMGIGEILDATFRLYRKHFLRFVTIVAVMIIPLGLLQLLVSGAIIAETRGGEGPGPTFFVGILVILLFAVLANTLSQGALFKSVSEAYLGKETSVGEAYGFVIPRAFRLIWGSILVGLVVVIGFILLIVPGIIFSLWLTLTIPVILLEGLPASKAMGRSRRLVSGNLGKVFGLAFILTVLGMIVNYLFQNVIGFRLAAGVANTETGAIIIRQLSALVGQILILEPEVTGSGVKGLID